MLGLSEGHLDVMYCREEKKNDVVGKETSISNIKRQLYVLVQGFYVIFVSKLQSVYMGSSIRAKRQDLQLNWIGRV